jgi:hypothetical protein
MADRAKIIVLNNEAEARLLEALLTERGIPHYMKSYHDAAYDGIWQTHLGWGHVEAPPEHRGEIEAIYADLVASKGQEGEAPVR